MYFNKSLLILSVLFIFLAASCGKPSCGKFYSMIKKCAKKEFKMSEDEFIKNCEKDKDKDEAKKMIDCSAKSECEEFEKCMKTVQEEMAKKSKEKFIKEDLEKLKKAVADKNYKDILFTCNINKKDLDKEEYKEIKDICDGFAKTALTDLTKQYTEIRDKGESPDDIFTKCYDFKDIAKEVSEEESQKAELLCKEIEANKRIKETMDDVKKNIAAAEKNLPVTCEMTIEDLDKIGSEWAKRKMEDLEKACYVDLGKAILKPAVEKMTYCEYRVKKIFEAVKKYNLKDSELDPLIEKATPECTK